MRLAFTIGSYRLCDFIRLGILQIRKLCQDAPILISDDRSPESPFIEAMAAELGTGYIASRVKRSHFGGDAQALVNSLAFAEATGCDVSVKVSQRFVLRLPEIINVIERTFSDPNIQFASPGQPKFVRGTKTTMGFGAFAVLSDIVMMRVGSMKPEEIIEVYRRRIEREKVPWKDFVESLIHTLHLDTFPGRSVMVPELTDPAPDPIYLRRYQCQEQDFLKLAAQNGFGGRFPCCEWGEIERGTYRPQVVVV